jgi:ribulose-phosphate 3-epimerase
MGRELFETLLSPEPRVLPSLLLCDFGNLEREIRRLEEAGVVGLHLDVMDGVFVPNFTYGLTIVEAIRRLTVLPLDVHLMMVNPESYIAQFAAAGADGLTVHLEAIDDPAVTASRIHQAGLAAGVALNPATPLDRLQNSLRDFDLVLVMSVPAGFGGQPFQAVALDKLRELRSRVPASTILEVDGGVNMQTIGSCARAGAQLHVVGSAIFRGTDYRGSIRDLEAAATAGLRGFAEYN